MRNSLVLASVIMISLLQSAHAVREKIATCPAMYKQAFKAGKISHEGRDWDVLINGFTKAEINQAVPYPARINCRYGETSVSFEVPAEFSGRTCSFDLNADKTKCDDQDPTKCAVYCERRKK
jgi:hypothetical protein